MTTKEKVLKAIDEEIELVTSLRDVKHMNQASAEAAMVHLNNLREKVEKMREPKTSKEK